MVWWCVFQTRKLVTFHAMASKQRNFNFLSNKQIWKHCCMKASWQWNKHSFMHWQRKNAKFLLKSSMWICFLLLLGIGCTNDGQSSLERIEIKKKDLSQWLVLWTGLFCNTAWFPFNTDRWLHPLFLLLLSFQNPHCFKQKKHMEQTDICCRTHAGAWTSLL